ncbi:MAG: class I SAM-dependent methyltransferase [Acidobacteriota bacterium]
MHQMLQKDVVAQASRERLEPQPGDPLYLPQSDLLLAMRDLVIPDGLRLLDYGAGLSPYRPLFPNADYRTADVGAAISYDATSGLIQTPDRNPYFADPDYTLAPDGSVPAADGSFDFVLSTQALEHVANADTHLSECFRLLRPGGQLYLSTHGSFEDHGSPYDFRRWTADGLDYDLKKHGFDVLHLKKLTTGPRAMMFFFQLYNDTMGTPNRSLLGLAHLASRRVMMRPGSRRWLHRQADRLYREHRVVDARAGGPIYLCLAALARRPD